MASQALAIVQAGVIQPCQPWPRFILSREQWIALIANLGEEQLDLLAAWADTIQVHALLFEPESETVLPVSVPVEEGRYPAMSPVRPGAAWYERLIHDLWGHQAEGGTDARPWLDHGRWAHTAPLAIRPGPPPRSAEPPEFQDVPGSGLMQVPVGPVRAGIAEAVHVRQTLNGDRIVRAESRLGYTHKGTLTLMRAKAPRTAARFAARLSGDATVAHSIAFARATEAALGVQVPPRAVALRDLMCALERITTHLDTLASVGAIAGSPDMHDRCGLRQERLRRSIAAAFGHRLMMDCVIPGGVAGDIVPPAHAALRQELGSLVAELADLHRLHAENAMATRQTGAGVTPWREIAAFAVDGIVRRAASARRAGDAAARSHARLEAIAEDAAQAIAILADLPDDPLPSGPLTVPLPMTSGEGLGRSASARGEVWHWLRLDHGQIAAVFPRDPGWALWPLAETVLRGVAVGDAELICASLGLPASGMDL